MNRRNVASNTAVMAVPQVVSFQFMLTSRRLQNEPKLLYCLFPRRTFKRKAKAI